MSIDYDKYIQEKEGKFFIKGLYNSTNSAENNRNKINIFQILHYLRTNEIYKNKEIIIAEGIYLSSLKDIRNLSKEGNNRLKITFKENVIILDCNIKDRVNFGGCIFEKEVNFNGSTFEQGVNFGINIYKQEVNFGGCIFEKGVNFSGSAFEQGANFFESTFKQKVHFEVSIFEGQANFSKSKFGQEANFRGSSFKQDVYFKRSFFEEKANFSSGKFEQEANFDESTFKQKIHFEGSIFEREVDFSGSNFKQGANFNKSALKQKAYFEGNTFEEVNFSESSFEQDVYFNRSIFKQDATFHNTKFLKNVRFHECEFKGVTIFNNTKFEKLVDFYYAKFYQPQQFLLVDFFDRAVFSNATFEQECQFLFCRVSKDSHINFESATFNKGLDISRSNFTCDVNFWHITIYEKNKESGENIFFSEKYKYDFGEKDENISIPKKIRESYRIIKNNFFNQSNKIDGLEYQKREMEAYWKELNLIRGQKQPQKSEKKQIWTSIIGIIVISLFISLYVIYKCNVWFVLSVLSFVLTNTLSAYLQGVTFKSIKENFKKRYIVTPIFYTFILGFSFLIFWDLYHLYERWDFYIFLNFLMLIIFSLIFLSFERERYLLLFNKYSNDFGTNWVRGIIFTLVVSLIFYGIFILSLNVKFDLTLTLEGVKNFVGSFLAIINIIDFKLFDNENAFIKKEDLSGWSYPILFIGRIFISYGYYQTIQAFRKFGKS